MAKKQRKTRTPKIERPDLEGFIDRLTLKDLKVQVVVRGMSFGIVSEYDVFGLRGWLIRHFDDDQDRSLLKKYDDWLENHLRERGCHESLLDPVFRLSGTIDEEGNRSGSTNVKRMYQKKKKKPRSEDGLIIGTKKYLVFELVKLGKTKEEVIHSVQEAFPMANDKSISNWYNRARKKYAS